MIASSDLLILEGMTADNEDGPNTGSVSWSSTVDGFIGDQIELAVHGLSPGEYQISLEVTDSKGLTGTDTVTVFVVQDSWEVVLPLMLRDH